MSSTNTGETLKEMFAAGQYKITEKQPVGDLMMYYLQAD